MKCIHGQSTMYNASAQLRLITNIHVSSFQPTPYSERRGCHKKRDYGHLHRRRHSLHALVDSHRRGKEKQAPSGTLFPIMLLAAGFWLSNATELLMGCTLLGSEGRVAFHVSEVITKWPGTPQSVSVPAC
ncbi:uncharacterized protein TRIREDRAFT_103613 [Trichoderma reesei QM6a]|uniref:Predicted protein n=2 Tax=Hypocrea jecorina TaxID=51453 RepID=G0RAX1_HYPJQ|nr:uncharacterized protein TRIREDRAFT_103613 [Trichoderma reesei QM6a]EGR51674.1 predicted protein [Trichoderma reesei QM6a]ETS05504.1 hypothetical protein M419DRAFT_127061 [Trichoderma reesei RUT C-30]